MKLLIIIMLSVFSIAIFIFGYGFFYTKDKVKLKITDFSKSKTITLKPYKWKPYAMLNLKVKGHVNDSIKINCSFFPSSYYYLKGDLDTLLIQTDYYGEGSVILTFEPYKATEGELIIECSL